MIIDPRVVAEVLLEGAIVVYGNDNHVVPTTFAIGHSRSIFAQPYSDDGLRVSREARIAMDALLISATGAVVLGRIDESFIQERSVDEPAPEPRDLIDNADIDPSIGTALTVQTIDTRTRKITVALARQYLEEDGRLEWDRSTHSIVEGVAIVGAVEACAMAAGIREPITDELLREELLNIGWEMIDSDEVHLTGGH